jgi:hypothetical protein
MRSLALLFVVACSSGPPLEPKAETLEVRKSLAADVVRLTQASCASCHTKSLATAVPAALAVFDYDRADWPSMLSAKRLEAFRGRARGNLDEAGQRTLDAFIAGELYLHASR